MSSQKFNGAVIKHTDRFRSIAVAISLSAVNQAIASGTNFALTFYLIRILHPVEFGVYGVGMAASMLIAGLMGGVFTTQMVVNLPAKDAKDRDKYAASLFGGLLVASAILAIGVGVGVAGLAQFMLVDYSLIGAAGVAGISYVIKDYFLKLAYTQRMEGRALAINVCVTCALAAAFLFTSLSEVDVSAASALTLYSVANFIGAMIGGVSARLQIAALTRKDIKADAVAVWQGGKWALSGVAVVWAQSQAYIYVTAMVAGTRGVAEASAARLAIAPILFLLPAVSQIATPRFASLRLHDEAKLKQASDYLTFFMVSVTVLYCALMMLFKGSLIPFLVGSAYQDLTFSVAAWCGFVIVQMTRTGSTIVLQVAKAFRQITLANISCAVLTVTLAFVLVRVYGVAGALIGVVFGELILSIKLHRLVRKHYAYR